MLMLLAGLIVFFVPHSVALVAPGWRNRMLMHLRAGSWKGVYSLISAAGLALMVLGFAQARGTPIVLYRSPAWLHYVRVADVDRAVDAVKANGGTLCHGPVDVAGGNRIAQCQDPQGAAFALHARMT